MGVSAVFFLGRVRLDHLRLRAVALLLACCYALGMNDVGITTMVSRELRKQATLRAVAEDHKLAALVRDWLAQYAAGATKIEVYR